MKRLILLDKSNLDPYFNSNNHHNFILNQLVVQKRVVKYG